MRREVRLSPYLNVWLNYRQIRFQVQPGCKFLHDGDNILVTGQCLGCFCHLLLDYDYCGHKQHQLPRSYFTLKCFSDCPKIGNDSSERHQHAAQNRTSYMALSDRNNEVKNAFERLVVPVYEKAAEVIESYFLGMFFIE